MKQNLVRPKSRDNNFIKYVYNSKLRFNGSNIQ